MSINLMDRVWYREDLRTMEKFVALALADSAGDDGACYPSIIRIAKKCSCVPRTVQIALRDLERRQLVRRYRRKDRTDFFQLIIENWPQCDRPNNTPKEARYTAAEWNEMSESRDLFDALPTGEGNSPVTEKIEKGRANLIPEGVNLTASTGEGDSPNTLEEPLEEPLEESGVDVEISLSDFIKAEWDKLKAAYPNMGECRKVLPSQLQLAKERAQQHRVGNQTDVEVWREAFIKIASSRFQTGRVAPTKGRNRYKLTLSELLKTHIFRETINGKYISTDADEGSYDRSTGEILGPAAQAARGTLERIRSARERRN